MIPQEVIAGFIGALIGSSKESHKNILGFFISVISGTASSIYITPVIVEKIQLSDQKMMLAMSFIVGTSGLKAVELITSKFNQKKEEL